jgi:predicted RNase H-like HicB family nuclease
MSKIYPAIFLTEDVGYSVFFPDLVGCQTQGDSLEEALEMAEEALAIYLACKEDNNEALPAPSEPTAIKTNDKEFVSLVSCVTDKFRNNKSVKKTLTIPFWLNEEAEKRDINFSQTLQEALKATINAK